MWFYLGVLLAMLGFVWLVGACFGGSLRAGNGYLRDWSRSVLIAGGAGAVIMWLMS